MKNRELQAAWSYHHDTKHTYQSVRSNPHYLDWGNQPLPFKIYSDLPPFPLPEHLSSSGMAALNAISTTEEPAGEQVPSLQTLAEIFYLSAAITRRRTYPGGEILFRAAACTGALYHIDLYLIAGDLPSLRAGVYHFGPQDFALRRLRAGDYRAVIARTSGSEPAVVNAPAFVICASTYWRNAWKYQSRAYRHCYWDTGTILANLLAASAARHIASRIVLGFVDATVSQLLALDSAREGVISLVALGKSFTESENPPTMEPLALPTEPLSKGEVDYPPIRAIHEASSLENEADVVAWREGKSSPEFFQRQSSIARDRLIPLRPLADDGIPTDTLEEVIQRRGSTRQFAREPISFTELSTILDRASRGIRTDVYSPQDPAVNAIYLIINAVEGLSPGTYLFHRDESALELLRQGEFRREAGHLGLGQAIPADASANIYFLADLDHVLERFGNRGYRVAQLDASVGGGKIYLAAYALGLGASGLTFFDDDVTEFFSPTSDGRSVMFLVAVGKSARRKKI
ncbi:MAG TPA: SagB/ThcOx family dehydrogenase [Candidatus Binatia bacterium]